MLQVGSLSKHHNKYWSEFNREEIVLLQMWFETHHHYLEHILKVLLSAIPRSLKILKK